MKTGKPLFEETLKYCNRCCIPETNEGMEFDELGLCKACSSSEQKMRINWVERNKELRKVLDAYRSDTNFDCIVPISGGKDSVYQLHLIKNVFKMNPIAVTFSHNLYTKVGRENRLMKKSLPTIGDACWHCHAGVGAFPLHMATKLNIPLVIYGESPAEHSGRTTYADCPARYGADHFTENSAKVRPETMAENSNITLKELIYMKPPSKAEIDKLGLEFLYLGDYIFWDAEYFTEFIIKHYGWQESYVEGTYKRYKSVECKMPGVHDFTKFLKRGFGRGTDFAAQDVRAGIITREEGFELAKEFDLDEPEVLEYFLECTGYTKDEFYDIMIAMREGNAKGLPGKEFFINKKRSGKFENK
jgi:hypothetical protein